MKTKRKVNLSKARHLDRVKLGKIIAKRFAEFYNIDTNKVDVRVILR